MKRYVGTPVCNEKKKSCPGSGNELPQAGNSLKKQKRTNGFFSFCHTCVTAADFQTVTSVGFGMFYNRKQKLCITDMELLHPG